MKEYFSIPKGLWVLQGLQIPINFSFFQGYGQAAELVDSKNSTASQGLFRRLNHHSLMVLETSTDRQVILSFCLLSRYVLLILLKMTTFNNFLQSVFVLFFFFFSCPGPAHLLKITEVLKMVTQKTAFLLLKRFLSCDKSFRHQPTSNDSFCV